MTAWIATHPDVDLPQIDLILKDGNGDAVDVSSAISIDMVLYRYGERFAEIAMTAEATTGRVTCGVSAITTPGNYVGYVYVDWDGGTTVEIYPTTGEPAIRVTCSNIEHS